MPLRKKHILPSAIISPRPNFGRAPHVSCPVTCLAPKFDYLSGILVCEPGSSYSETSARCEHCLPGYFTSHNGSDSCTTCEDQDDRYQDEPGQTFCKKCPPNTRRRNDKSGTAYKTITGCVCESGYWAPDVAQPHICEACKIGGICTGGSAMPYAKQG